MRIEEVFPGEDGFQSVLLKFNPENIPEPMSGRDVAIKAMHAKDGARILMAYTDYAVLGATSFRKTDEGIKRINTGVLTPRQGVGRALIEKIKELTGNEKQWCKSHPQANGFCEALGMIRGEVLPNGWVIYRDAR